MTGTPSFSRKTANQPLTAGEVHTKFMPSLPGNIDREILGNIEVDS